MWTRTDAALETRDALGAVDDGAAWAVLWCAGGLTRSSDARSDDLDYVRHHLIGPQERERLFAKARRKGRTKTVVMAERWTSDLDGPLVLFYESGPYLLPERRNPFASEATLASEATARSTS